jgi:hypothetical protein
MKTAFYVEETMPAKTKRTQPITANKIQRRDVFQTPKYATDLLIPYIPKHITCIWECASGEGRMALTLQKHYRVYESDLEPKSQNSITSNFLSEYPFQLPILKTAIVTNPPFSLKKKFYERCLEIGLPFALLIPADYAGWIINAIDKQGCEKLIPNRRIDFITPNAIKRINERHNQMYELISDIPDVYLMEDFQKSHSDFHSLWLTWGFGLGKSEVFVELTNQEKKTNI